MIQKIDWKGQGLVSILREKKALESCSSLKKKLLPKLPGILPLFARK